MIRAFLKRRKVRRALAQVIDPTRAESLLHEDAERQPIKKGRIEFILAFVRGDSAAQVSERISCVADLAIKHGATVHDLIGALVVMTFGTQPWTLSESGDRSSLVSRLREQLEAGVKIVHGAAEGHYGLFGNQARMSYTFLVPDFDLALGVLARLEFGESQEFQFSSK